jgi:predicted ATPase/DNA-binding CsgD family transcriptional regulator
MVDRPGNLPVQPSSLIGREREVDTARDYLLRPDVRLLTLTGTGGIGKTRLALEVAANLIDAFEHGVFLVSLAPIRDPDFVIPTIAQTLGIREHGGLTREHMLVQHLRTRSSLLVLDNFEQVAPAAPSLADLLAQCPLLKVLATSRAPLHVRGEHEFPVPPLSLPDLSRPATLATIAANEAVALFTQRARAIRSDFQLTDENVPAVAEICARLDGLPLAIELAAARVKVLSPPALLARLGNRLQVLTGGPLDLPARQQTLRSTIDWSHDLLSDRERALFCRLSVFTGGCALAGAEAIGADHDLTTGNRSRSPDAFDVKDSHVSVLDLVTSLVDKSLLRQVEQSDGEPRLFMLETVREYGLDRLATTGEIGAVRRAHAAYYVALAEQAEPNLTGADQSKWFDRLEIEHDNFRLALGWSLEQGEIEMALRLGAALWRFWFMRGYLSEGRRWLEGALARSGGAAVRTRLKALGVVAFLVHYQGDYPRAAALAGEALTLARQIGDKRRVVDALNGLAVVARSGGNYAAARTMYRESLALLRDLGDRSGIAFTLTYSGLAAWLGGDYPEAARLFEESLLLSEELGDRQIISYTLFGMAQIACEKGEYDRARSLVTEAAVINRDLNDRRGLIRSLWGLGRVALGQDDLSVARASYEESLALAREIGDQWFVAAGMEGLAAVAAARKQPERAACLFGAASTLRKAIGAPMPTPHRTEHERGVAAARALLDERAFDSAWQHGSTLTPDQAIAIPEDTITPDKPAIASRLPTEDSAPHAVWTGVYPAGLTSREVEVLRLVTLGLTDAEVAERLVVSPRTVQSHLRSIYDKLGVTSRTAAARYAIDHRLA